MARAPRFGGTCDCGGDIYEVRRGVNTPGGELIIGPGQHVGWKCRSCDKEYSHLTAPVEQEAMKKAMQPIVDKINK